MNFQDAKALYGKRVFRKDKDLKQYRIQSISPSCKTFSYQDVNERLEESNFLKLCRKQYLKKVKASNLDR